MALQDGEHSVAQHRIDDDGVARLDLVHRLSGIDPVPDTADAHAIRLGRSTAVFHRRTLFHTAAVPPEPILTGCSLARGKLRGVAGAGCVSFVSCPDAFSVSCP